METNEAVSRHNTWNRLKNQAFGMHSADVRGPGAGSLVLKLMLFLFPFVVTVAEMQEKWEFELIFRMIKTFNAWSWIGSDAKLYYTCCEWH